MFFLFFFCQEIYLFIIYSAYKDLKKHISCFMEKLPECNIYNFKKKISWRNAGEK